MGAFVTDQEKIDALKLLAQPLATQVISVGWGSPDGTIYYAGIPTRDTHPFRSIPASPVEARLLNKGFIPFTLSSDLTSEDISLSLGDVDLEIQRLFHVHGEGVRVEIFYYYPEVDLMISRWFGQLSSPDSSNYEQFNVKASNGYMSRLMISPKRAFTDCAAIFGGRLATQDEIDHNDCYYNRGVGGSTGNLNGMVPFTSCPKRLIDCSARLGDTLSFLGFDVTAAPTIANKQGQLAVSRGNASNLKRPLRRVYGYKTIRDLDLLAWRREPNISHPDKGFVAAIWAISEGSISAIYDFRVNDGSIPIQASNFRTGEKRQPPTSYGSDISNFSGTALAFLRMGWVNANEIDATSLKTQVTVRGANNIRVYTDEDTYTETFTNNRVWCLMDAYANKRAMSGYDYARFNLTDWGAAANDSSTIITHTDVNGIVYSFPRSQFDCDMQGRQTDDQIRDICISGRLAIPYQENGKLTTKFFKKEDISDPKIFTDTGRARNILFAGEKNKEKSTLTYSQVSDKVLANQIILTFEDSANADVERPLTFGSEEQQLASGRAFGDTSLKIIEKRYTAYGIRNLAEAVKLGESLLYLGELDSGGIANNLALQFDIKHADSLDLKRYEVIKVVSPLITIFGFQYFRVMDMKANQAGDVSLNLQAYPETYYETFETEYVPPEVDPWPGYTYEPPVTQNPREPIFDNIGYENGFIQLSIIV